MSWATHLVEMLGRGETVSFRPRGNSMTPRIESGQLCTVAPCRADQVGRGDIVLCKVRGNHYLHLVHATNGNRFLIGNNHGHQNGWVGPRSIYGKLMRVDP